MPKTKSETTNKSGNKTKKIHGKKQDLRERYRVTLDRFTKAKEDLSDALKKYPAAAKLMPFSVKSFTILGTMIVLWATIKINKESCFNEHKTKIPNWF